MRGESWYKPKRTTLLVILSSYSPSNSIDRSDDAPEAACISSVKLMEPKVELDWGGRVKGEGGGEGGGGRSNFFMICPTKRSALK